MVSMEKLRGEYLMIEVDESIINVDFDVPGDRLLDLESANLTMTRPFYTLREIGTHMFMKKGLVKFLYKCIPGEVREK
jgi:hypothetical protein